MSIQDVAAVDHLNSLRQRTKKTERQGRSPYHASLPASPTRNRKLDGEALRRSMAKYQASLSRPESPQRHGCSDNLPTISKYYSSSSVRKRDVGSPIFSAEGYGTILERRHPSEQTEDFFTDRKQSVNSLASRQGFRTVTATGMKSSARICKQEESGLAESPEYESYINRTNYPYLARSSYSLPRSHRQPPSSRESPFRELFPDDVYESPSFKSKHRNPTQQQTNKNNPENYTNHHLDAHQLEDDGSFRLSSFPPENDLPQPRIKNREIKLERSKSFHNQRVSCLSIPTSPMNSQRSSRATSPSNHVLKGPEIRIRSGKFFSRRSSRTGSPSSSNQSSQAGSPSNSQRSSRATSPSSQIGRSKSFNIQTPINYVHNKTSSSARSSQRSSRAPSPSGSNDLERRITVKDVQSGDLSEVIYVRETFKVVPASPYNNVNIGVAEKPHEVEVAKDIPGCEFIPLDTEEKHFIINSPAKRFDEDVVHMNENRVLNQTDESKVNQQKRFDWYLPNAQRFAEYDEISIDGTDVTGDLEHDDIDTLQELLESISFKLKECKDQENSDSARADSVSSIASEVDTLREKENKIENDGDKHSLVRRQSVIIQGLTLETDELRKRCQKLEEDMKTPVVEDLSLKLEKAEGKLEETENYCYQVVEENVELKSEIETLELEISEVQDTFRDKDAKEFKRVKRELEHLTKTCRNLQIKLGKAQAKASRLRQEKEEIEENNDQSLWKTTAVMAVTAVAAYQLFSRLK